MSVIVIDTVPSVAVPAMSSGSDIGRIEATASARRAPGSWQPTLASLLPILRLWPTNFLRRPFDRVQPLRITGLAARLIPGPKLRSVTRAATPAIARAGQAPESATKSCSITTTRDQSATARRRWPHWPRAGLGAEQIFKTLVIASAAGTGGGGTAGAGEAVAEGRRGRAGAIQGDDDRPKPPPNAPPVTCWAGSLRWDSASGCRRWSTVRRWAGIGCCAARQTRLGRRAGAFGSGRG